MDERSPLMIPLNSWLIEQTAVESKTTIDGLTIAPIDYLDELVALFSIKDMDGSLPKTYGLDSDEDIEKLVEAALAAYPELSSFNVMPSDEELAQYSFGALPPRSRQVETGPVHYKAPEEWKPAKAKALAQPEVNLVPKMDKIRDQGKRGSCTAFATTAVREFLLKWSTTDMSEQYL